MGRKASKFPPLPYHKPNKFPGLPHPVNTDILLSKPATLYDFACFSALRDPTWREEQLRTTELAVPTWCTSPTCYHLNRDESTTKKYFGVQGECFGGESFWLGGFWGSVATSLTLSYK